MKKVFKVADIREYERKVALGEISYSRMVEILNEMANKWHQSKVNNLSKPDVIKSVCEHDIVVMRGRKVEVCVKCQNTWVCV